MSNASSTSLRAEARTLPAQPMPWLEIAAELKAHIGLLLAVCAMLFMYVAKGPLIALVDSKIAEITVQGELQQLSASDVSGKVSPWLDGSFLTADLDAIKAEVESLAWVKAATVRRVWPGQIVINAQEQRPVVSFNEHSYMNAEAQLFAPKAMTWPQALPALLAPSDINVAARQEMLAHMAQLQSLLGEHNLSLSALELKARGVWQLTLADGLEVALGKPPFEDKIERMAAVLNGAIPETRARMAAVDTRYPNGVAIKWKAPEQQAAK